MQVARLRWLVGLRWGYILLFVLLLVIQIVAERGWGGMQKAFFAVTVAYAVDNFICAWLLRRWSRGPSASCGTMGMLAELQGVIDLAVLMLALHFTGGWMNILICLPIFHLAVTASVLPARQAYLLALATTLLFVLLVFLETFAGGFAPHTRVQWMFSGYMGYLPFSETNQLGGVSFGEFMRLVQIGPSGFTEEGIRASAARRLIMCLTGATLAVAAVSFGTVYFINAILARLRRINARLIETNRQLAGLDLAKSRFLRVSSHQLRGPLAAIHSLLSAMEQAGPLTGSQQELSHRIQARAGEAMAEIDEMMLLSTIKEHASETRPDEDVDLAEALRRCVADFDAEARQKGVSLTLDAPGTATVHAWEDAAETVFEHLLSNAIKYTPSGGSVSVRCTASAGEAVVEVRDTGIGIPADQQASLFREFFRATNARQLAGGTGLGLSIVKAIVERLGGQINIQSAGGEGTTVRVVLPTVRAPAAVNDV